MDKEQSTADWLAWWYHLRFWWATASGWLRRWLGLGFRNGRTVSEVVYELEKDPLLRELLKDARKKIKAEDAQ